MRVIFCIVFATLLASCAASRGPSVDQIKPVCTALMGPIKYNTYNPKSHRFAGDQLAPDLAARNRVGQYLGCPAYR